MWWRRVNKENKKSIFTCDFINWRSNCFVKNVRSEKKNIFIQKQKEILLSMNEILGRHRKFENFYWRAWWSLVEWRMNGNSYCVNTHFCFLIEFFFRFFLSHYNLMYVWQEDDCSFFYVVDIFESGLEGCAVILIWFGCILGDIDSCVPLFGYWVILLIVVYPF